MKTPRQIAESLEASDAIEAIAHDIAKASDVLYIGRGLSFPIALEGALKLKEISYIHAEGYAAGELKHGPIALIDENLPVVVIAPMDVHFEKTLSNMHEVMARGGKALLISCARGIAAAGNGVWASIEVPETDPMLSPPHLCGASATPRLLHRNDKRHGCGSAAQSRKIGDCGIGVRFDYMQFSLNTRDRDNRDAAHSTCAATGEQK